MGWALAGFDLETGSTRNFPEVSDEGLQNALVCAKRVEKRFNVQSE